MIQDPWNPKAEEIEKWAYSDENWPEQGWDIGVCNGENDPLLYKLASDLKCPKHRFFLHTLYFTIGDALHSSDEGRQKHLLEWIGKIQVSPLQELNEWKEQAILVLNHKIEFDYDYWCDPALERISGKK
ncbi:hypothetical protein [Methylomonas methanica]|uniref:Uncharacterized protein n=1 Tax=Methylomonas methanica (strain DSM 25384 / MC09) TaxID=857087 RepID=G0A3G1_METMM|nr:hypothetical protein [Methylomonas methanica]AEG00260.1 hypothetical protein Metme_1844 [Methylomonas methanica MC09]